MPTPSARPVSVLAGPASGTRHAPRVVVAGGGLGGLLAACAIARDGHQVRLLEAASELGGRARTDAHAEAWLNRGAHAVYRAGHLARVLRGFGIKPKGGRAVPRGLFLWDHGETRLPSSMAGWATGTMFPAGSKLAGLQALGAAFTADTERLREVSVDAWLRDLSSDERARGVLRALIQVSTYVSSGELSAGVALSQVRAAAKGVDYLDGGWRQLVEALLARARSLDVEIVRGTSARSVEGDELVLADGARIAFDQLVVALPRAAAKTLLGDEGVGLPAPVEVGCLDLVLNHLPRPERGFALGASEPLYLSVHSDAARLVEDGVVVHGLFYGDAADGERRLEAALDRLQPGWQTQVRYRRYLPRMEVCGILPTAKIGGLAGRPGVVVDERVTLVGDYVGARGLLADATAASAEEAAGIVIERVGRAATTGRAA